MTSIRKSILVSGNPHFVEVNSSLDLEEVEITGTDPTTGKTVHVSLSSLLRTPRSPDPSPYSPQPLQTPSLFNVGTPASSPVAPAPSTWMSNAPTDSAAPAPMDMFSEPLPAITPPAVAPSYAAPAPYSAPAPYGAQPAYAAQQPTYAAPSAYASQGGYAPQPTIVPPLTSAPPEYITQLSSPAAPAVPEVIQAREPQGLEALDDPLPDIMESHGDEVVVDSPTRPLVPSLKRTEKQDMDDALDSMYRH